MQKLRLQKPSSVLPEPLQFTCHARAGGHPLENQKIDSRLRGNDILANILATPITFSLRLCAFALKIPHEVAHA